MLVAVPDPAITGVRPLVLLHAGVLLLLLGQLTVELSNLVPCDEAGVAFGLPIDILDFLDDGLRASCMELIILVFSVLFFLCQVT